MLEVGVAVPALLESSDKSNLVHDNPFEALADENDDTILKEKTIV